MSLNIRDVGIILSVKKYSENSLIIKILSKNHGICDGFVKGGAHSKKNFAIYQISNLVDFTWRSRSFDSLGFFKIELIKSNLAKIIFDNLKLNSIKALFEIIKDNILEREPHEDLFSELLSFLEKIDDDHPKFLTNYIKLELALLKILGYGIDLSSCAVTGKIDDLCFVSPKSGRAACREVGLQYSDKLLKLPEFLTKNKSEISAEELLMGLNLSNFFFKKYLGDSNSKFFEFRSKVVVLAK